MAEFVLQLTPIVSNDNAENQRLHEIEQHMSDDTEDAESHTEKSLDAVFKTARSKKATKRRKKTNANSNSSEGTLLSTEGN